MILMEKAADQTYQGRIVGRFKRPGYNTPMTCDKCPGEFKGKPLLGLVPIWGAKPKPDSPNEIYDGKAMDQFSGRIYIGKGRISKDGQRMTIRGYLGISALGRTQTWIRATSEDIATLEPRFRPGGEMGARQP